MSDRRTQTKLFEEWIQGWCQRGVNLCSASARPTDELSLARGGGGEQRSSISQSCQWTKTKKATQRSCSTTLSESVLLRLCVFFLNSGSCKLILFASIFCFFLGDAPGTDVSNPLAHNAVLLLLADCLPRSALNPSPKPRSASLSCRVRSPTNFSTSESSISIVSFLLAPPEWVLRESPSPCQCARNEGADMTGKTLAGISKGRRDSWKG